MKKLINKLLCCMWWHQFSYIWWNLHNKSTYITEFETCIHCGTYKHDLYKTRYIHLRKSYKGNLSES